MEEKMRRSHHTFDITKSMRLDHPKIQICTGYYTPPFLSRTTLKIAFQKVLTASTQVPVRGFIFTRVRFWATNLATIAVVVGYAF